MVVEVPTTNAHDAAMEEASGPRTVTLCGVELTLRSPCPMGAFSVFAARQQDPNPMVASSSWPRLVRAWIVPEDHGKVDAMFESVESMDEFANVEGPKLVEAATARPT